MCIYVYVCVYIRMYVCHNIYVYTQICIYIYICVDVFSQGLFNNSEVKLLIREKAASQAKGSERDSWENFRKGCVMQPSAAGLLLRSLVSITTTGCIYIYIG